MISNTRAVEDNFKSQTINSQSMANILVEMMTMGIDPKPFLEMTAHDLLIQYGSDAIELSSNIEKSFIKENDFQSAEIWQKISRTLKSLVLPETVSAH